MGEGKTELEVINSPVITPDMVADYEELARQDGKSTVLQGALLYLAGDWRRKYRVMRDVLRYLEGHADLDPIWRRRLITKLKRALYP